MFAIGILVAVGLFVVAGLWYRQPNSRFSSRILGRDVDERQDPVQFLRAAAQETARVLRAWRTASLDPNLERHRQLMSRRYRILASLVLTFGLFPLLFELIGLAIPVLVRGGPVGIVLLTLALAILVYGSVGIARPVVAYGNGQPLDRNAIITSALGVTAIAAVLVAVVALAR
jgi:hypothetical protein